MYQVQVVRDSYVDLDISRINYLCVVWSFFSQWKETGTSQVQLGLFETAKLG